MADHQLNIRIHCPVGVMREDAIDQEWPDIHQLAFHLVTIRAAGVAVGTMWNIAGQAALLCKNQSAV